VGDIIFLDIKITKINSIPRYARVFFVITNINKVLTALFSYFLILIRARVNAIPVAIYPTPKIKKKLNKN
jgi:hypothetical protein